MPGTGETKYNTIKPDLETFLVKWGIEGAGHKLSV